VRFYEKPPNGNDLVWEKDGTPPPGNLPDVQLGEIRPGVKLSIWWNGDGQWYKGTVIESPTDEGQFKVRYSDNDESMEKLHDKCERIHVKLEGSNEDSADNSDEEPISSLGSKPDNGSRKRARPPEKQPEPNQRDWFFPTPWIAEQEKKKRKTKHSQKGEEHSQKEEEKKEKIEKQTKKRKIRIPRRRNHQTSPTTTPISRGPFEKRPLPILESSEMRRTTTRSPRFSRQRHGTSKMGGSFNSGGKPNLVNTGPTIAEWSQNSFSKPHSNSSSKSAFSTRAKANLPRRSRVFDHLQSEDPRTWKCRVCCGDAKGVNCKLCGSRRRQNWMATKAGPFVRAAGLRLVEKIFRNGQRCWQCKLCEGVFSSAEIADHVRGHLDLLQAVKRNEQNDEKNPFHCLTCETTLNIGCLASHLTGKKHKKKPNHAKKYGRPSRYKQSGNEQSQILRY